MRYFIIFMLFCSVAHAEIDYPLLAITDNSKLEFLYIAQEKLRLEHNAMGEKFKNGEITKEEWLAYKDDDFDKKSKALSKDIAEIRQKIYTNKIKTMEPEQANEEMQIDKLEYKASKRYVVDLKKLKK